MMKSVLLLLLCASPAFAADRIPVAVLWVGDPTTLDEGARIAGDVNNALTKSKTARPIDSIEERERLVQGGAVTRARQAQLRAEASFVKMKLADAVRDYEAAEQILLTEVPFSVAQTDLGGVERSLLVCYDQLGKANEAARAAERLTWTAGDTADVKAQLDRHLRSRAYQPAFAPVKIVTEPAGALVYRNMQPVGAAPVEVPGGDPAIDVIDVELAGHRRAHMPLPRSGELRVALQVEDRTEALVDDARTRAPATDKVQVRAVGRKLGARRVLAIAPDGTQKVTARWLDVPSGHWGAEPMRTDSAGPVAMDKLVSYVAPKEVAASGPAPASPPPPEKKSKWGAWGKWYTWVAAGGVLALVAGLLIAQNVGDDNLKVQVTK
jgi:hypothetical protein